LRFDRDHRGHRRRLVVVRHVLLVVAGIASQLTAAATIRGALRAAWWKSGGRQMRSA
jgi:hypothetical protein